MWLGSISSGQIALVRSVLGIMERRSEKTWWSRVCLVIAVFVASCAVGIGLVLPPHRTVVEYVARALGLDSAWCSRAWRATWITTWVLCFLLLVKAFVQGGGSREDRIGHEFDFWLNATTRVQARPQSRNVRQTCRVCGDTGIGYFRCLRFGSHFWCIPCVKDHIWSSGSHPPGAASIRECMNQCGVMLTIDVLKKQLAPQVVSDYSTALTRTLLNGQRNVVWCRCGAAFDMEWSWWWSWMWCRGRCLAKCSTCRNFICFTCRDTVERQGKPSHVCAPQVGYEGVGFACPKCGVIIEKDGGCVDVTCRLCNCRFVARLENGKYVLSHVRF